MFSAFKQYNPLMYKLKKFKKFKKKQVLVKLTAPRSVSAPLSG